MTDGPRIPPRPRDEWDDETREIIDANSGALGQEPLNIFTTLAHHQKLLKRWLVFGTAIMTKNLVPAREREIAILRTGWNCRSEYEFGQHVVLGRLFDLTDDEIVRITEGPDAGWSGVERAVIVAADELHEDQRIGDDTWAALVEHFDDAQMIELVMTVGQYHLVAMTLNSLGVELDDGVPGWSDLGLTPPG